jgi:hypothetical protein
MSNIYTYEVLKDTTQKAVIKLTANFDGSGQEYNVARIQANTLYGALDANNNLLVTGNTAKPFYNITISRIGYNIASQQKGYVELFWNAANTANIVPIFNMDLCGQYSEEQGMVTIRNNAVGATGDIGVQTFGLVANCAYTLIVELRKDNAMYQRGQFNDPAAFNAPPYNLNP